MLKAYIKSFLLQKDGEPYLCQDRIGINLGKGRFVVADGVSQSYQPEVVSETLCEYYISDEIDIKDWPKSFDETIYGKVCSTWKETIDAIEKEFDGIDLEQIQFQRETLPAGASTFAGIEFDFPNNCLKYTILGDSCLFVTDEQHNIEGFCTNTYEDLEVGRYFHFDNHPKCIVADGNRRTYEWEMGEVPIKPGYVLLMTDGAAEWFQKSSLNNNEAIEILWALNDHNSFSRFVADNRKSGIMDDDIAIIIIKLEETGNEGFEILFQNFGEWYPDDLIKLDQACIIVGNQSINKHINSELGNSTEAEDTESIKLTTTRQEPNGVEEILGEDNDIEGLPATDRETEEIGIPESEHFSPYITRIRILWRFIRMKLTNLKESWGSMRL